MDPDLVHRNAAGATLPLAEAQDAIVAHLHEEARMGPHLAAEAAADRLAEGRKAAARLVGADGPRHIAFGEKDDEMLGGRARRDALVVGARILVAR